MTTRQQAIQEMFNKDITSFLELRNNVLIVGWSFEYHKTLKELQSLYNDEQIEALYDEYISGSDIPTDEDDILVNKLLDNVELVENYEYSPYQYRASLDVGNIKDSTSFKPYIK